MFTYRAHRKNGKFHNYVGKISKETIAQSHDLNDGTVPDKLFLKKQWYKVSTLFLGHLLADLNNISLSEIEKKRLVYLGAAMGLCDALVDDHKVSESQINSILIGEHQVKFTAIERIFSLYYHELVSLIPEDRKAHFIQSFKNGVAWQLKSLRQFSEEVSEEEIHKITKGKGGISIVLCKLVLNENHELSDDAMMSLGAFIQAMNDVQDLPKDAREDVKTFASFKSSFSEIHSGLEQYKNDSFELIKSLKLQRSNKERFTFNFHAMYTAICFKLSCYDEIGNGALDFNWFKSISKDKFKVNPYSWKSLKYCLPKILNFRF